MYRVLIAPEFKISPANPDFPIALLDTLKGIKKATGSNYVSFWAQFGDSEIKSNVIVSTYPSAWLQEYTDNNYSRIDPCIQKGLTSVGAIIFEHDAPGEDHLVPLAKGALKHRIGKRTIGIPVHIGKDIRSVTTFATDVDVGSDGDEQHATLAKCCEHAHILALDVVEPFMKKAKSALNLTNREIEVLYWGSHGKTDQETADRMKLSRWTVVSHVQSAKSKLRVSNKAAAIARAVELKLFFDFDQKLQLRTD